MNMSPPSLTGTLLRALLWLAAAFLAGTVGAFVVGFVCGVANGAHLAVISQSNLQGATFIGAVLLSAFAFHRGALREARRSPDPRIRASVDPAPIRRWPIVVIAALVLTPFGVFLAGALARMSPQLQQANFATNPVLLVVASGLVATVTPIAEETFFRGWLWTALSVRIGALGAAAISGFLFLFAHVTEALLRGELAGAVARGLILLPLAVILSLVRALCASQRAPMIVHGLYNLAVTASPLLFVAMARS
jgi:membrane protease YdiL (CAAX protease family)